MAPTKHPSAWRLNKGEQTQVDQDLALWEGSLPAETSEEEKTRLREDERKRLIRLVQQAKHDASLQKQSAAGAKNKAKAQGKAKAAPAPAPSTASAGPSHESDAVGNYDYYEQVKQDLAVISKVLACELKDILPTPIAATVNEKTGVQDNM